MNENFRKLARCNERIENFLTTGPVQRAALEQFAELIVRECANIDFWATGHVTDRGADVIGCKILDHFGVE
jgi:hypothetical protein